MTLLKLYTVDDTYLYRISCFQFRKEETGRIMELVNTFYQQWQQEMSAD